MTTTRQRQHQAFIGACRRKGMSMKAASALWVRTHGYSSKTAGHSHARGRKGKGLVGDLLSFGAKYLPFSCTSELLLFSRRNNNAKLYSQINFIC